MTEIVVINVKVVDVICMLHRVASNRNPLMALHYKLRILTRLILYVSGTWEHQGDEAAEDFFQRVSRRSYNLPISW